MLPPGAEAGMDGAFSNSVAKGLREAFPQQAKAGLIPDGISGSSDQLEVLGT